MIERSRLGPLFFSTFLYPMNKFFGWILLFFFLLLAIPILLLNGSTVAAKLLGVVTVLVLSFSVRFWLYQTKKAYNPKERIRISLNDRFWMNKEISSYNSMSVADKRIFEDRIGILLSKVPICLSSGELLHDRQIAFKVAAFVLKDAGGTDEFPFNLPSALILESGRWDENMKTLSNQPNVKVLSIDF